MGWGGEVQQAVDMAAETATQYESGCHCHGKDPSCGLAVWVAARVYLGMGHLVVCTSDIEELPTNCPTAVMGVASVGA